MTIGMAIVLVATVGFLIVSPGFRKVTGVIAAGAIVLLLLFWIANRPIESRDPGTRPAPVASRRSWRLADTRNFGTRTGHHQCQDGEAELGDSGRRLSRRMASDRDRN